MRVVAVVDGTLGTAAAQARALAGFLYAGLSGGEGAVATAPTSETVVFFNEDGHRDRLVSLAPTPAVRLVRVPRRHPDRLAEGLATWTGGADLFVFAAGPAGTETATRLARRSGGAVLVDVVDAAVRADRLVARRRVYSNHMVGRFALSTRPWCVTVDPSWTESPAPDCEEHRIVAEHDATAGAPPSPFTDLEPGDPPSASDLATSRVVVVAGAGAGSRDGVARLAAAARRLGAAFGVTRPVAMNTWAPVDRLVGVSGARVAPSLALVIGASGAPAFLWGIEGARTIVAVNTDEHAPIVRQADLTVVGDGVAVAEALADLVDPCPGGD